MANIDQAFGLRPIAKVGSAPGGTTGTTKYSITSGASALFTGDPVKPKADGSIEVATAGDPIRGIFLGFSIQIHPQASLDITTLSLTVQRQVML